LAFSGAQTASIGQAIAGLANAQFNRALQPITADTLLRLFVPADLRDLVSRCYRVAAPKGTVFDLYAGYQLPFERGGNTAVFRFKWDWGRTHDAFLPVHGAGQSSSQPYVDYEADAPAEMVQQYEATLKLLCDISYRFGMVRFVFQQLNAVNKTPAQMRFVWPAILMLLRKGGYGELANEIEPASIRAGDRARVPEVIADYLKPAGDMVARAGLIEMTARPQHPVEYRLDRMPVFNHFEGVMW
jgi:hypothetical protein